MSRRGRPSGSGYRSQIVLLWSLINKGPLCFHELVEETNIDENRVYPNLQMLIEIGFVKRFRSKHKMMYKVPDKEVANKYLWNQFMKFAGVTSKRQQQVSPTVVRAESSDWKTLHEGTDFVIDKKIGVITFSKTPKTPIRVTYKAGYEKTPEPIAQASAILAAGFLHWILSLKGKKRNDINSIPKKTWKQAKQLIGPFRKCNMDNERETLLKEVGGYPHEIHRLEGSEGLKLYKDYDDLLRWAKELKSVERLKATQSMTKGARELRTGPKRQKHQDHF